MATKHPNITDLADCACYPSFAVDETKRAFRVASYKAPDGRQQKLLLRSTKLRTWSLHYRGKTRTEIAALRAFFDARQGEFGLFYFDDLSSSEVDIPVYLREDTFRSSLTSGRSCTADLEIEETVE